MKSDKRRPRILICEKIHEQGIAMLRDFADVDYLPELSPSELQKAIVEYDGLIVEQNVDVDAELIRHGFNLKMIGRVGSRLTNIDLDAARQADILVVNSPDANTIAVAEHTMALMLALARQLPQAVAGMKTGQSNLAPLMGMSLSGKTLGIVGFGRVGRQVAIRAQAFGMKVLVNQIPMTPELKLEEAVTAVDLNDFLHQSDFITLHIPLRAETENLIGAAQLAQMKPSAYLINTARGGVIDELALWAGLQNGRIAGAALDVFTAETAVNQALIQHPNVIATPHIAASTDDAQQAAAITIAELFIDFFQQVDVETVLPLRVVPMDRVFPHENIDPKRVNRLAKRLDEEQILGNPPIVTEVGDGTYIVDGATRSSALKQLNFPHAIVQVINSEDGLGLKTWYHVIQQIQVDVLMGLLEALTEIILEEVAPDLADKAMFEYGGLCYIHTVEDRVFLVQPKAGANRLDALNQLTATYISAAYVDRTLNNNIISLKNEYEEMAAVVIFPEYTVQQVIQTTLESGRLFPAGITRFLIPGRILRLQADLSVLRSKELSLREKNRWLHEQLLQKQAKGGIRFYGESVYLLDE